MRPSHRHPARSRSRATTTSTNTHKCLSTPLLWPPDPRERRPVQAIHRTAERLRRLPDRLLDRQAKYVATLTDDQLGRFERGLARSAIITSMAYALPLKFKPAVAGDLDCVMELRFVDPAGAGPDILQINIADGGVDIARSADTKPDVTVTLRIADLIRIAAGSVEPGWLIHDRRITMTGDAYLFFRFPALFGLPAKPRYA